MAIKARIGELSLAEDRRLPRGQDSQYRKSPEPPKHERLGLKQKQMHTAQTIARHPRAVEEVIREAEENEDIHWHYSSRSNMLCE